MGDPPTSDSLSADSQNLHLCAGPEYGTTEAAWKAVLVEADRREKLHSRVKEELNGKVNSQIRQWQKENYHKVHDGIWW